MDTKNWRKRLAALLLGAACSVAVFSLAACGPENEKDPDENDPPITQVEEFTVTFDANGGTLTGSATVKVKDGEKITGAPTASKEGFTFDGWFTAKTGGTEVDLAAYEVESDVTLYAQYTEDEITPPPAEDTVTVTFDANGGTLTGGATVEIDKGTFVATDKIPSASREGYIFLGWFDAKEGGSEVTPDFDYFDEDTTLYAHWATSFTVTFDAGKGELAGAAEVEVVEGNKITKAPVATLDGSEFYGWFTQPDGAGEKIDLETYKVTEDITLYAHFGYITMPLKNLKDHEGNAVGYRIEAEEAKAEGELSSERTDGGEGFIEVNQATASGNASIGYFGVQGNTLTFTFWAEEAGTAEIALRAASNNTQFDMTSWTMYVDDQIVTEKDVTFTFNGEAAHFDAQTLRGAGKDMPMTWNYYWDPISLGELEVKEGLNSLVVTAQAATVPNIDCLDIETELTLTSANGDTASGEAQQPAPPAPEVAYEGDLGVELVIGAYEGGPAVSKAIIDFGSTKVSKDAIADKPLAITWGAALGGNNDKMYLSDAEGNELTDAAESQYVTIEYAVSYAGWSFTGNLSPFTYTNVNVWKDFSTVKVDITGVLSIGGTDYTTVSADAKITADKSVPDLEAWDLTGTFTKDDITLTYGSFGTQAMKDDGQKNPLIIWLHGAGEGGTDPSINILGNQVTNLSKDLIQKYFTTETVKGAYVLAPQTPTAWLDKDGTGAYGTEEPSQYYVAALKGLIDDYIAKNGDIDMNRIYIGGCSNGGFMTVNMIINFPEFFAAAFPICEAYDASWLTAEKIEAIKDLPIWFTHAANDNTVSIYNKEGDGWLTPITPTDPQDAYTNNLYVALINAGATNVHYTLFENVLVDGVNYDGHWSWIFTLRDECLYVQPTEGAEGGELTVDDLDYSSEETVQIDGEDVTLWGWLAAQVKEGE